VSAPLTLSLTAMNKAKQQWSLVLYPDHLALAEAADTQPYVILRSEMMKSATLIEGMRVLALTTPIKATFKMEPPASSALADWVGKPVLALYYLRRRYSWVLPVAVLWVIGSMPISGDSSAGREPLPFDPIGLVLGLTLIAAWGWAKWRPHPVLFLVDSLWFLVMAGHLVMEVAKGRSKGWLVLVALLLWMVVSGLRHFARFRGTRLSAS
jgi:hypothetical protein